MANRPRVIIIGAGFGGLFTARKLANKQVDVLLIDRNNFHTFTPLIYQVATCALDPSEVAYPVRSIFEKDENIRFLLGDVTDIDTDASQVMVKTSEEERVEPYDYLVVAAGSNATFFNNSSIEQFSFQLDTLEDAIEIRNHILQLFERAEWTQDFAKRDAMTTIVVVGGGPTGLETAGAIYELYNYVLQKEFKHGNLRAQVILVEMQDHLLAPYPDKLQKSALKQLKSLGVKAMLERRVEHVGDKHVVLDDGTEIPTHTLIWAAGVKASPLADMLNVELARGSRVPIKDTTEVIGLENVYVVGDMAYLEDENNQSYPMLIPVAQQQGILAAKNIINAINGEALETFSYSDRGIMATIGRRRAVAWIFNRIQLSGFLAWLAWLGLHIITLMGFRNRINVLVNWIWNYLTYDRSVRIILNPKTDDSRTESEPVATENS